MARPKLVIAERLSVELAGIAHEWGLEAYHVAHRGLGGAKDHDLRGFLAREEAVLVTNNGKDFLKLYEQDELHPGLVILVPNLPFAGQKALLEAAIGRIAGREDLVNRVIEVHSPNEIREYEWPEPGR